MPDKHDFHKDWEIAKKHLVKFSKEAVKVAKKSEKEIFRLSKISKIQIDSTAAGLKKEQLYYLIGKEYIASKDPASSEKLKRLVEDLDKLTKKQASLKSKLKSEKL
ncbi:MAG: hypothetical protein P9X22_04535 [Candidatus Zapsychrus exili]|nr:hypothetical protein [Candidatus Zapsychrus exili]